MDHPFKIYIDRLKDGQIAKIEETVSSDFLDIREKELSFPEPVQVKGQAYITDDHLIIQLKTSTVAYLPCSICNEPVAISIDVQDFYHVEPLEEVTSSIYDFIEDLRESILLQVPPFAECRQGNCPERASITKFLKNQTTKENSVPNETHFPFSELEN